jgi:hypothetical protein
MVVADLMMDQIRFLNIIETDCRDERYGKEDREWGI